MNIKQGILITITGTSLLISGGCPAVLLGGAAAGGTGTVLYEKGKLHSTEDASVDRTWDATQAVTKIWDLSSLLIKKTLLRPS